MKPTETTPAAFPEALINEELKKIFTAPVFAVSEILRRFLSFVVLETIKGHANRIKEYTIGINVLNKPAEFKPQQDAIVRIHAGRLRRALHQYYNLPGKDDPIHITIPKGGYVPLFNAPETVVAEDPPAGNIEIEDANIRFGEGGSQRDSISITVLPFGHAENDESSVLFAKNLGEQLSAELVGSQNISVIAYFQSPQVNGRIADLREVLALTGAQYVITGYVQSEKKCVRITVQLISTATFEQLWSQKYNRYFTKANMLEIQDDIVTQVIGSLTGYCGAIIRELVKISGLNKINNGKIFDPILWYYHFHSEFSREAFYHALNAMERAIERDGDDEFALAFLGELYVFAPFFNYAKKENLLDRSLSCANRAIKIDPLSQYGYLTLGWANIFLGNKKASLEALEYALSIKTHPTSTLCNIGFGLICVGEYDKGVKLIERSMNLNKYYPSWLNIGISLYHFKRKEYELAYSWAKKMKSSDIAWDSLICASSLAHLNNKKEAASVIKWFLKSAPDHLSIVNHFFRMLVFDEGLVKDLFEGLRMAGLHMLSVVGNKQMGTRYVRAIG
jgi:TolB-like protein